MQSQTYNYKVVRQFNALQLGASRESWQMLPGISSRNAVASDPVLFSAATLRGLTIGMVSDPRLEGLFLPAVDVMAKTQSIGDLQGVFTAVRSYVNQVQTAVANGQLTADAGQTLIAIAKTL